MEFHQPASVEEAVALLSADEEARCLAGGATLVAMMNAELVEPSALVSLRKVESLCGIVAEDDGGVRIGAMTTHRLLAETGLLSGGQTVVRRAARTIGHPAIRNMGTMGGAICHGDAAADYPAALVAAGATVGIQGPQGARSVPAEAFFTDYLETALAPGELATHVTLPASPAGSRAAYEKFARVEGDFATASVAVVLGMAGGECAHVRIAAGSCGPRPVRVEAAERALIGTGLDDGAVEAAAGLLAAACDPIDDVRGSGEYRLMLLPALLGRALRAAREGE